MTKQYRVVETHTRIMDDQEIPFFGIEFSENGITWQEMSGIFYQDFGNREEAENLAAMLTRNAAPFPLYQLRIAYTFRNAENTADVPVYGIECWDSVAQEWFSVSGDENNEFTNIDEVESRIRVLEKADRLPYVVALYKNDRARGGPEEGGWYYDCGEWIRPSLEDRGFQNYDIPRYFTNEDDANEYARRGNDYLNDTVNVGRRDISSVLSEGRYEMEVMRGDTPPEYWPAQRPHYC
jgi:hypothetical protein